MLRLPFLTLTVAMLLLAVYAVTGSRAETIQASLNRVHLRHELEPKVAVVLAEACARRDPADANCIARGERAARFVLGQGPLLPADADERRLVEEFRDAPLGVYELPGYQTFAEAWQEERGDLSRLAADENILLGHHWSPGAAFWSLWEHASLAHLFFNVVNLVLFGVLVEWLAGKRAWTFAYFGGGLLATASFAGFFPHELTVTLGASPGVYALMGLYIVCFIQDLPEIAFDTARRRLIFYGAAAYVALDLGAQGLLLASDVFPLHFTGFLAGLSLGILFRAVGVARPRSLPLNYEIDPVAT